MLALLSRGFVMLSMPKCASTSVVASLRGHAEIVMRVNPTLKHMNCRGFHQHMVPILESAGYARGDYEVVTLFREPISWLESWWRYRQRPSLRTEDPAKWTGEMGFETFVERYLDQAPGAIRGRQARFVSLSDRLDVGVDRIFALDRPDVWQTWLAERVGEPLEVENRNWSTSTSQAVLSPATHERLTAWLEPEYDVWERLQARGSWAPERGHVLAGAPAAG